MSTLGLYLNSDQDNTDWTKYYNVHPASHGTSYNVTDPALLKLLLGAEGCMWGETNNGDVLNAQVSADPQQSHLIIIQITIKGNPWIYKRRMLRSGSVLPLSV